MRRKYKTGSRWAFWRWTDVDSEYITRLHVIKTPWFAICVHWINKPDPEPYLHDHPVSFLSVILRGGYWEHRVTKDGSETQYDRYQPIRRYNWVRATPDDRHTIVRVWPRTVTLCFMGPKRREWGFHTSDGWVYWRNYYAKLRQERASDC